MFATAHDGTRIPYTLIHRKGLELDGTHPAWISAYGSYGITAYSPAFNPRTLALIDAGAIVGYAGVRGGGEYGREWHKAGQLANKPNTWRDLIAVCEELCAKRYTSREHLAIGGRSAGGITVGRAMTERPDLFAAVIDGVGWSNPLRYVAEQNGYGEEPEWGAISSEAGYRALKAIDSYQSVKDGTAPRAFRPRAPRGNRCCCAWISTPATASACRARNRIAKPPIPTRSSSAGLAS
jgi:prolyl oligopeptidase